MGLNETKLHASSKTFSKFLNEADLKHNLFKYILTQQIYLSYNNSLRLKEH